MGRKSELNQITSTEEDNQNAIVPESTTAATSLNETQATESQAAVPEAIHDPPLQVVDTTGSGLNERYQERLKSRFRGAGYVRKNWCQGVVALSKHSFYLHSTRVAIELTSQVLEDSLSNRPLETRPPQSPFDNLMGAQNGYRNHHWSRDQ